MREDGTASTGPAAIRAASEFADRIDVGLVAHGPDGSIVGANDAACALLGLTRDQILGRTSMDTRWGAVHEDGSAFPGEEHPAMVTLRTGASCTDVVMGVDATGFERRWIAIRSAAVDLPEHGVAVVATFVDVGDRVGPPTRWPRPGASWNGRRRATGPRSTACPTRTS